MIDKENLEFGVQVFFMFFAFILILNSIPEESLEAISNAGEVTILMFNISLICFSIVLGKGLMAILMLLILFFLLILKKYRIIYGTKKG